MGVFPLGRSEPSQLCIEVLASASEGLLEPLGFGPEPLGAGSLHSSQQLFVELISIAGDPLDDLPECHFRAIGPRPPATRARSHQDRSGQNGGGVEEEFLARQPLLRINPLHHGSKRHFPYDKPVVTASQVDAIGVPFAELVIGTPVDGVVEIEGSRINGQLTEGIERETGFFQKIRIGLLQQLQCSSDQFPIRPFGDTHVLQVNRHHADTLVGVRLSLLLLQHGQRTVSDVVVQLGKRSIDDAPSLVPWASLAQNQLHRASQKKRAEEAVFDLVKQEVGVEIEIGGKDFLLDKIEHGHRLGDVAKSAGFVVPKRLPLGAEMSGGSLPQG